MATEFVPAPEPPVSFLLLFDLNDSDVSNTKHIVNHRLPQSDSVSQQMQLNLGKGL